MIARLKGVWIWGAAAVLLLMVPSVGRAQSGFVRGDLNCDQLVDSTDVVLLSNFLFLGDAVVCDDAADVNDDGVIAASDLSYLNDFVFGTGAPPPAPFPSCGTDPTEDGLGCAGPCCDAGCPTPANVPPQIVAIGDQKVLSGVPFHLNFSAFDLEDSVVELSVNNLPPGALFDPAIGTIDWEPSHEQTGTWVDIELVALDLNGASDIQPIDVHVALNPATIGDVECPSGNGTSTSADIIAMVNFVFKGGDICPVPAAADVNADGNVTSADIIYMVNFVFKGGAPPLEPPIVILNWPPDGYTGYGDVLVSASNLTSPGESVPEVMQIAYSSNGVDWVDLPGVTPGPCDENVFSRSDWCVTWNLSSLPSGDYQLRARWDGGTGSDEDIHAITVNQPGTPTVLFNPGSLPFEAWLSASGWSDFDGDPPSYHYSWYFPFDSLTLEGCEVARLFPGPGDYDVVLHTWDPVYGPKTEIWVAEVIDPVTVQKKEKDSCICQSIQVITSGEIPKDSRLRWSKTNAPDPPGGDRYLGPVEQIGGKKVNVRHHFMIEATGTGNVEACSTSQYVARTLGTQGKDADGNYKKCSHKRVGGTDYPYDQDSTDICKPNSGPTARNQLGLDDYVTDCAPDADRPTGPMEKIQNGDKWIIRWLDAPGYHATGKKNVDKTVCGMTWRAYFLSQVISHPACDVGCEVCFDVDWEYDDNCAATGVGSPDVTTHGTCVP